ncbi:MAG: hypothetical protein H0U57_15055 [Tatlockia sp.]|nr:hypothetical protein [Tatlockia sp.]
MRVTVKRRLAFFFLLFIVYGFAVALPAPWFFNGEKDQLRLRVDLYISTTCPHCQHEEAFISDLQKQKPWLDVQRYEINTNKASLEHFHQQLLEQNLDDYSVPALFFCGSRWVGFDTEKTTGKAINRALDYCYQQITKDGQLTNATQSLLNQWSTSSTLATNTAKQPAYLFIPIMALSDALSSCSIFAVLALFAFLWLQKEKSLMFGYGLLFILVVSLVHYVQQSNTAIFYQNLPWLRIPAALLGFGLIAYVFIVYSKGLLVRPGFLLPVLIGATALLVMSYQQTCLPNFPLIFRQWLDLNQFSSFEKRLYVLLYNLIYILPLLIIMVLIIYSRIYEKLAKSRLLLVYLAWCLLLVIGLIAIIHPQGFANLLLSIAALIFSLVAAWVMVKKSNRLALKGESTFGGRHE